MRQRSLFWKLDGHTPVPCTGPEWAQSFEARHAGSPAVEDRWRVARHEITTEVYVSTVFLGLDNNYAPEGPPLLFETMILGLPEDHELHDYQTRCSTWEEAEAMHAVALSMIHPAEKIVQKFLKTLK